VTSDPADEYEPNWSPDGKGLVFVSGTGIAAKSIEYVDLASKKQHTLLAVDPAMTRVDSPSFSPDGKHLAYVLFKGAGMFQDEAHLVVTGADGGEPSYTGNAGDTFPFPPTGSPMESWCTPRRKDPARGPGRRYRDADCVPRDHSFLATAVRTQAL
jgi:Tol biopolymer transport system component